MRRLFLVVFLFVIFCPSQAVNIIFENSDQRWDLVRVENTEQTTVLHCDITIKNNRPGCFDAHKYDVTHSSIYLEGVFGKIMLYDTSFSGDYEPWIEYPEQYHWDYYDNKNQGKIAHAKFIFPRIPAGIRQFDFHFKGGTACEESDCEEYDCPEFVATAILSLDNINSTENSGWTEERLALYFSQHRQIKSIEGIYSFYDTNDIKWWGNLRHKIAIIKSPKMGYDVIYLSGSNPAVWTEGEIKGNISQTATKTTFVVNKWFIENKTVCNKDLYIQNNRDNICIYNVLTNSKTTFIKLNIED